MKYLVIKKLLLKTIKNIYKLDKKFLFNINQELIRSEKSIIIDKEQNKYIFDNILINLSTNELVGKELKVEFKDSYFGNSNNRPVLKGRSGYSNEEN